MSLSDLGVWTSNITTIVCIIVCICCFPILTAIHPSCDKDTHRSSSGFGQRSTVRRWHGMQITFYVWSHTDMFVQGLVCRITIIAAVPLTLRIRAKRWQWSRWFLPPRKKSTRDFPILRWLVWLVSNFAKIFHQPLLSGTSFRAFQLGKTACRSLYPWDHEIMHLPR